MAQRIEYRVVWKREGRQRSTRIYQSWSSAYRKAQGILALDAVKAETSFHTLPDLEERPTIQTRPVGDWMEQDFPVADPGDYTKNEMKNLYPIPVDDRDSANVPF